MFRREPSPEPQLQDPSNNSYDLHPNPTTGQFSLMIRDGSEKTQLHAILMTEMGVILAEHDITGLQTDFDLSGHANGLYILEVTGPQGTETWKIIKR